MRFRDLRWHIILSCILVAGAIMLAFIYILPVKDRMQATILNETKLVTESKVSAINTSLETYEFLFTSNAENPDDFTIVGNKHSDYLTTFANTDWIITQKRFIYGGDLSADPNADNYYIFIYDSERDRIGQLDFDKIFTSYNSDETYFFFKPDGTILSSNYSVGPTITFFGVIRSKDEGALDDVRDYVSTSEADSIYTNSVNFNEDSYIAITEFAGMYYAHIVAASGNTVSLSKINEQVMLFYSLFIGALGLSFAVMILGFKRASKLFPVDQRNYKKSKAIVIRMKIDGRIIFMNRTLKLLIGSKTRLNNIRQFNVEKEKNIIECYRKEQEFIVSIDVNDKIHYFNLVSILSGKDYFLIGFDITKQYLNNQFLLSMSAKNPVTKMDNMLTMASDYVDIVEAGEKVQTAFVYVNVLNFRETNKVFGRKIGDSILIELSKIITAVFADCRVYHMDADRFIAVIQNEDVNLYNTLCERMFASVKAPIQINNNHIYIKLKLATYEMDFAKNIDMSLDEIRHKLDIAMEKAKSTLNKDLIAYDESLEFFINSTHRMELALAKAVKNGEFVMHFQPQYDIFKNKIVSFEALIRWNHPEFGKKSPQVFIELAEQNGYILDIGKFVIQSSFRAAKELEKYNCHVSINVSPAQIFQAGFVSDLISEFQANHLKPGSIAIEITETFLMENFDVVIEKLKLLKKQGFSIHLDDFGTGYSSMLYLKDLPIDTLKIDKEFTKTIEIDKFSLAMVKKICSMGEELNLDIICEGVETQGQSNLLKTMGCRIIQGWLIGKAMPLTDAFKAIEHYNGGKK